jgi:hypothetical protein
MGIDVLPEMAAAMVSPVPIERGNPVLGWSLIRETFGLPGWSGLVVGSLLLAIPASARAGIGIAVLSGLTALVLNLWHHYLPVIAFAVCLLIVPLGSRVIDIRRRGHHGAKPEGAADRSPEADLLGSGDS